MGWRAHRYAPAPGSLLCALDGLADGACRELQFGDGDWAFSLILYRRDVQVRVFVNSCPHFSLPLNSRPEHFLMLAGERIMCAWHCAVFRLSDGHCLAGPAEGLGLDPVPVEVRDGFVYLGA